MESHRRAVNAIEKGYFKEQIMPIELKTRKGTTVFDKDVQHPRGRRQLREGHGEIARGIQERTARSPPATHPASTMARLLSSSWKNKPREALDVKPMARLVSYGLAGVDPKIMGIGPVPPCKIALDKAGLTVSDMDVIEANEAFAVQALAVSCDLKFDSKKTNPNGGAVGLGHPIGATGAF